MPTTLPTTLPLETQLAFLARLVAAGVLAGVLGWEREQARKPAGFRTHIVVGIGTALFTVLGEVAATVVSQGDLNLRSDPARVIQAVATGIGFIGSGIIFVSRDGAERHVRGLTTAASIWTTAAISMACGFGLYALAAGATALQLFAVRALARLERGDGV